MISRRQILQSLAASAAGALAPSIAPSPAISQSAQRIGSAANRAQIIDLDFDVSPYLAHLKSAGVTTIGRYYDRAYGSGIGESCYRHPLKTLTKAELTAIENAGMSVYVVFQHCGAQCVNFDLQNKETAGKGRKDAEAAIQLAHDLGQPAGTPIYFAIDYDPYPGGGCTLPAERIWPSIDAYFDQVNEVLGGTHWQVGVYGAGITCRRLKASGKARYFWLSSSLGHLGQPEFFNSGALASLPERDRDQAQLRAEHHRHRRRQSGAAVLRPVDLARARRCRTIPPSRPTSWRAAPS